MKLLISHPNLASKPFWSAAALLPLFFQVAIHLASLSLPNKTIPKSSSPAADHPKPPTELSATMPERSRPNNHRGPRITPPVKVNHAEQQSPNQLHQQAIGNGIGNELQRTNASDSRNNPHLLNAQKQQHRPQTIRKLCRQDQRPQRSFWRHPLRSHGQCKVPQEHSPAL